MKLLSLFLLCLLCRLGTASSDVQLDGVDDSLSQASTLGTFVAEDAFTLMLYLKSTGSDFAGTECYEGAFLMGDSGPDAILIGRTGTAGETACAYTLDASSTFYTIFGSDTSLPAGWHHYALRLGGGTLTLFVDGVSVATRAARWQS